MGTLFIKGIQRGLSDLPRLIPNSGLKEPIRVLSIRYSRLRAGFAFAALRPNLAVRHHLLIAPVSLLVERLSLEVFSLSHQTPLCTPNTHTHQYTRRSIDLRDIMRSVVILQQHRRIVARCRVALTSSMRIPCHRTNRSAESSSSIRIMSSARPLIAVDDDDENDTIIDRKDDLRQKRLRQTNARTLNGGAVAVSSSSTTGTIEQSSTDRSENNTDSSLASPRSLTYTGGFTIPITSKLHIVTPQEDTPRGIWPVYRLMVCGRH